MAPTYIAYIRHVVWRAVKGVRDGARACAFGSMMAAAERAPRVSVCGCQRFGAADKRSDGAAGAMLKFNSHRRLVTIFHGSTQWRTASALGPAANRPPDGRSGVFRARTRAIQAAAITSRDKYQIKHTHTQTHTHNTLHKSG